MRVCNQLSKAALALAFLLVAWPLSAQPPAPQSGVRVARTVRTEPAPGIPVKVSPGRFVPLELAEGKPAYYDTTDDTLVRIVNLKPGAVLVGIKFDEPADAEAVEYTFPEAKGTVCILIARNTPGKTSIKAFTNGPGDGPPVKSGSLVLEVVGPRPPPGPIDPPLPIDPPGPTPPPEELPIAGQGLRVLIVYESGDITTMPATQQNIIYGRVVRESLNAKCAIGPDGKTREYRIWDKDVDASSESKLWQDALKVKRDSVPWVAISNGKKGFKGPLPKTVDEMLALIDKYAK